MSNFFTIESKGILDGYIDNRYGKHGEDFIEGMPSLSVPLNWKNSPYGTKSYVLVCQDFDAVPVTGFSWIHWVAVIPGDYSQLNENASLEDKNLIQGVNSWISSLGGLDRGDASHYGGPAPPDKDHTYTFELYALNRVPQVENGFYLNEILKEMKGSILGKAILTGIYKSNL